MKTNIEICLRAATTSRDALQTLHSIACQENPILALLVFDELEAASHIVNRLSQVDIILAREGDENETEQRTMEADARQLVLQAVMGGQAHVTGNNDLLRVGEDTFPIAYDSKGFLIVSGRMLGAIHDALAGRQAGKWTLWTCIPETGRDTWQDEGTYADMLQRAFVHHPL
jgi:hypothetical protein